MARVRDPREASLNRGLGILHHLAGYPTSRGVTQVAKEMGLTVSTAHDLLQLLCQLGFVIQDTANHRYRISPQFFTLIQPFASRFGVVPRFHHFLRDQAAARGITIYVSVLWGGHAYVVYAQGKLGGTISLGSHSPAYASSCAKAVIARMPATRWRDFAPRVDTPKLTPFTKTDPAAFLAELKRARKEGVAFNEQETMLDVCSTAFPLSVPGTVGEYALAVVYSAAEFAALTHGAHVARMQELRRDLDRALACDSASPRKGKQSPSRPLT